METPYVLYHRQYCHKQHEVVLFFLYCQLHLNYQYRLHAKLRLLDYYILKWCRRYDYEYLKVREFFSCY